VLSINPLQRRNNEWSKRSGHNEKREEGERSAILEDKMFMKKSRREVNRARQTPRRRKGPLEASTLHHRVL
jgi:hypothetical protein